MARSRVYGTLAGYADQNDHATLRSDPVFKIAADRSPEDHDLVSQPAGAGAAFNAPTAGAVFVQEELVRRFQMRTPVAALGASATAIAVSRLFLSDVPDFAVDPPAFAGPQKTALFYLLGVVAGKKAGVQIGHLPTQI
jgi:hypothetical protein